MTNRSVPVSVFPPNNTVNSSENGTEPMMNAVDPTLRTSNANDSSVVVLRQNILRSRDKIAFFQINCHKCINSNLSLNMHSRKRDLFCYMVQEPYCTKSGKLLHLTGGARNIIRDETLSNGELTPVRAAIVHSKNFPITPVQQLCTKDFAAGLVSYAEKGKASWQKQTTLLVSSYWDIKINKIPDDLARAVQYARSHHIELQINIDSNCHSTLFGSRDQNERGDMLEDFMAVRVSTMVWATSGAVSSWPMAAAAAANAGTPGMIV